jgi:hypothetical protein
VTSEESWYPDDPLYPVRRRPAVRLSGSAIAVGITAGVPDLMSLFEPEQVEIVTTQCTGNVSML